jgi:hypothetical protein
MLYLFVVALVSQLLDSVSAFTTPRKPTPWQKILAAAMEEDEVEYRSISDYMGGWHAGTLQRVL